MSNNDEDDYEDTGTFPGCECTGNCDCRRKHFQGEFQVSIKRSRSSLYRGYGITIDIRDNNNVTVSVRAPGIQDGGPTLYSSDILSQANLGPQTRIRDSWRKGVRYVDKHLELINALRETPEHELFPDGRPKDEEA